MVDRVTRDWREEEPDDSESDEPTILQSERNLVRIVLLGTHSRISRKEIGTFKRGADSYPRLDAPVWPIEGENLRQLMGLLSAGIDEDKQLDLGTFVNDPSTRAVADGNRWFQRHAAVLGSTGSGKSWAVALILERAGNLDHPNLIVLDMHGEYGPLAKPSGDAPAIGQQLKIAGPGDSGNLDDGIIHLPWWLLTQEEMFALVLDRSEDNAPNQAARFAHHVRALKEEAIVAAGDPALAARFTLDSPVFADLEELVKRLEADDTQMVPGAGTNVKQGPFFGKLGRFVARLNSRKSDRRYAFMFSPDPSTEEFGWVAKLASRLLAAKPGIKIVDFSEVPSDVLPIVVGVFARLLYQIQFWTKDDARTPLTFVCDEAHLYLPADETRVSEQRALDAFERIAKEGRKYGVSLMVISQRPSDVSKTVLSQCNNFMILRLTNDQDRQVVQRLVPDNLSGLTASVPLLDIGEAIVLGDSLLLPSRLRLNQPAVKPTSATRDFWTEWQEKQPNEASIAEAVANLRRQGR
jgi:DNA helicase HerA-like ATPase